MYPLQVRNFIDIFMPTAFLIKIFAIKINKHLNYWTIISINCNTSLNTSDCRRTDRTPGLKVDPRAEQGPGGMQAFSLQNGQSKQGCMWQVCPPEGMTWDSSRAAESRLCPLWASSNISMSGLVWYCGSSGVTVIEVPLSVPRCSLTWPQSISLWNCAYIGLVLKLTDQWCLNNLDTQLAIRTSSFFFFLICLFFKKHRIPGFKETSCHKEVKQEVQEAGPRLCLPQQGGLDLRTDSPMRLKEGNNRPRRQLSIFFLSGSRNIDNTGS